MSKIFKVSVEVELYFYGSEPPEDAELAEAVKNEVEMENAHVIASSVSSVEEVDPDWRTACPYGEGGDRHTVAEWLMK